MQRTEVLYDCYGVTVSNDVQEYRIEASVQVAGELPHVYIFVYKINDTTNSALDIFQRVANPQDIQNLKIGRSDAIANSETEYLTNYCMLQYSTLDVAVQAKSALTTRINDLVNYWITYTDSFITDNGNKLFPSADPEYEQSLKDTYKDAKDTRIQKEADLAEATTAVDTAKTSWDYSKEILPIYEAQKEFCTTVYTAAWPSYVAEVAPVESVDAQQIRTSTIEPEMATLCSDATSQVSYWTNQVTIRKNQYDEAVLEKGQAETALVAAQKAEDEALAAVLEVCQDFDPSSV